MKKFLMIIFSVSFICADVLFFLFVFSWPGDKTIIASLLLLCVVAHMILIYQAAVLEYKIKKQQNENQNQNTEDFLFKKG